jgi:hypothetical protein
MEEKISGFLNLSFEEKCGYKTAQTRFNKERVLAGKYFNLI